MSGNPRENISDQGFWDGGTPGQSSNRETGGRPSGYPGRRKSKSVGIKTDIEFPPAEPAKKHDSKS